MMVLSAVSVHSQLFGHCILSLQVKRSFGLCNLQVTYFDEENEEVSRTNRSTVLTLSCSALAHFTARRSHSV